MFKQKSKKSIILICILFYFTGSSLSQSRNVFTYIDKDSSTFSIDFAKEIPQKDSAKTNIIGFIFERTIDVKKDRQQFESWVTPYNVSKLNISFNVLNINDKKNYTINFKLNSKKETNSFLRSTLFLITCDSNVIKYLKENQLILELSCPENLAYKKGSKYYTVFYLEGDGYDDYQWKVNQLLFNLEKIPTPEIKKEHEKINKNHFQLGVTSSVSNTNSPNFDDFTSQEIDLHVIRSIHSSNIQIGAGISFFNYQFRSTDNALYSISNSPTLDTVYASVIGVNQEYHNLSLLLKASFTYKVPINSNYLSLSISPFFSIYNKQNSVVTNGEIKTYGKINGVNEYLYDIDELDLRTLNSGQLNQNTAVSTSTTGLNLAIGYELGLRTFTIVPTLDLKFISLKNKNEIIESYSLNTSVYNGFFSTQKGANFFSPSIGISIIF